jgi:hypothetical protein
MRIIEADLPADMDPPKAPLRGGLILTGHQERELTRYVVDRLREARASYASDGWMERRSTAMQHYQNNVNDRRVPGSIFEKSNMTLNLPKRYVRITSSRVYDEVLSGNPFMAVTVEGKDDDWEDARVIERFCGFKLEQAKVRLVLREAEMLAAIRGEAVVKTTWRKRVQKYYRETDVMVDEDGQTVRAGDGNPVTLHDAWNEREDGAMVLDRDPAIVVSEANAPRFEMRREEWRRLIYDGLEMACVDHRDFYCNTTEPDIHSADFCAVMVDMGVDEVQAMLRPVKDTPEALEFLERVKGRLLDGDNKAHQGQPDDWRGERERPRDAIPVCPFAEIYCRVMLGGEEEACEVALLLDLENEQLVTYDYLDNISPTGRRPFRVVRMEAVPHRWYGTGFYELFADRHKFCDLFLNRVNLASSLSGNIKIENPMATEEGLAGEPIEFGTVKTYRLREGYAADDVFRVIPIPNDSASSENLLNLLMQVTQLEAGVVSAGDHGMAGLPAAGLATGIKSLDRVANVLLKNILADFITAFEEILHDAVALILTNYEQREAARLMGEEGAATLAKHRELSMLPFRTKIMVSTAKDADVVENHSRAFDMLVQFEQMPPTARERLRPVLMKILSVMGIEDVDKALSEPDLEEEAMVEAVMEQAGVESRASDGRMPGEDAAKRAIGDGEPDRGPGINERDMPGGDRMAQEMTAAEASSEGQQKPAENVQI